MMSKTCPYCRSHDEEREKKEQEKKEKAQKNAIKRLKKHRPELKWSAETEKSGPATALLIGMISLIATDSCFHPLITHETGNYNDPDPGRRTRAVQLHRRFETILDVYFAGTMENIRTFSLKKIMRECESDVHALVHSAFMQTADDFDYPGLPEDQSGKCRSGCDCPH